MGNYFLVRHKVRDFSSWKRAYYGHLPKRVEVGLTGKILLRGATDENEIIILFEAKDLVRAKAFSESSELREIMLRAVVDSPDNHFLKDQVTALKAASGF